MDLSVQKVLSLPELRELIFTYLLFDKNQVPNQSAFRIFRLVCKAWLETTNHLIYRKLRNIKHPYEQWIKYIPVRFSYKKIPGFIKLIDNICLKTAPALPFELVLPRYSFIDNITEGEHHKAITTLLNKFSDGLVKITLPSPCSLENVHSPNIQIVNAAISSRNIEQGIDKDIQTILDGARNFLNSFTFSIRKQPSGAQVLPVRFPENLHNLCIYSAGDISDLQKLLSYNMNSVANLQHLHISVKTQTTSSNSDFFHHFLSNCSAIKCIYIGRHPKLYTGKNTIISQFSLPKWLTQMESMEFDLFGKLEIPEETSALLETSARYPKWKELNVRGFAKEDLNKRTTYYPSELLKRLTYRIERSLGLSIFELENIHLTHPNLTYLEICVENQKSLEYIFSKMTNLKTLHVQYQRQKAYINWDAVLLGCSNTEIGKLREDYKKNATSVTFVPNEKLPSIRNIKDLQTLILYHEDPYNDVPEKYRLSDVALLFAFFKMDNLLKLKINLRNVISASVQQILTNRPDRSIYARIYFDKFIRL